MADTEESKLFRLVGALTRKTRDGQVAWEDVTSYDEDLERYQYSTASSTVEIGYVATGRYIVFSVKNSRGVEISTLRVTDTTQPEFDEPLHMLFDVARRDVLKIDETLDSLISELEQE